MAKARGQQELMTKAWLLIPPGAGTCGMQLRGASLVWSNHHYKSLRGPKFLTAILRDFVPAVASSDTPSPPRKICFGCGPLDSLLLFQVLCPSADTLDVPIAVHEGTPPPRIGLDRRLSTLVQIGRHSCRPSFPVLTAYFQITSSRFPNN